MGYHILMLYFQENITQERSQWERLKIQENTHIDQENALIEKQKVNMFKKCTSCLHDQRKILFNYITR